jgi:mono/diheme cytochrome c family protein
MRRARWLAAATAIAVVALAALFAWLRNPPPAPVPVGSSAAVEDPRIAAGRQAFVQLGCAECHAIDSVGNRTRPLDGVGGRRDVAAIRAWAVGVGEAQGRLPSAASILKSRAADAPELPALVDYLATLR